MSGELPLHPADEERVAAEMARELEAMTMTGAALPTDGFADRVMLAIADEPLPQPVRAFGIALLGGHVRAAVAAVGDAWRTISSRPAPMFVRAQALALVLVVLASSLAVAGGATVGAFGLLANGQRTPTPSGPLPSLALPSASPSPTARPEASPSETPEDSTPPEPSGTTEATETPGSHATPRPTVRTRTPEPTATGTDDHGGGGSGSGDGGSGSGSGDGGGGGSTPSPTGTDGHSGSDG
jgi:uncharacterized membrane protein YgcG